MARTGKTQLDWVTAGQSLLIKGGIDAVKLHQLTKRLDVSTGSFYHHFKNLSEYHAELADYYGSEQAQRLFHDARASVGDEPEALLREATGIFARGSMRQLNIAMRAWAHRDERARAAVGRYDKVLAHNLDQIFTSLGFDELAAKSRTLIMMGLASLEFAGELEPPMTERWRHIRELVLAKEPCEVPSQSDSSAARDAPTLAINQTATLP